ncbi:methionyl-tRNA formyltransferase [Spiroplasma sp. TIUS-1]|uniref:methionyl-tRNA formyltransferase n=1 Tax=Spiroplasma sp. TIUS-1 TaxID=216963 RepID=UPI0013975DDA|nr:methionyl-tRNA formyltransferase [Spiroplasma sp. TIUS-1]QHX35874.1 methionyl-tRNA formyltransferase [Spiroplasma sp. TIUS-1]
MKIIFCGTPKISANILKAIHENKQFEVVGVISQPDKVSNRGMKTQFSEVKKYSLDNGLKLFQPDKMSEIIEEVKLLNADFLVTCAFGKIISEQFLKLFKNCLNFHASLLPKYRGGSPVQFAIMNGDTRTGVCLMQMVKKMDAGGVYCKREIEIGDSDDNEIVFDKLTNAAIEIVSNDLLKVMKGEYEIVPQDESKVTFAFNLKNNEEQIDWTKSAEQIYNFIRALKPKPLAFTYLDGTRINVLDAELPIIVPMIYLPPGTIFSIEKNGMLVMCGGGMINLKVIQKEGKKPMETKTLKGNSEYIRKQFKI